MDCSHTPTKQRKMTRTLKHSPNKHTLTVQEEISSLLDIRQQEYDAKRGGKSPKNAKSTYLSESKEDAIKLMALLGVHNRHFKQLKNEKRLYANRNSAKLSRELKQSNTAAMEQKNLQLRQEIDILHHQLDEVYQGPGGEAIHRLQQRMAEMQQYITQVEQRSAQLEQDNMQLQLTISATPSTGSNRMTPVSYGTLSTEPMPFEHKTLPPLHDLPVVVDVPSALEAFLPKHLGEQFDFASLPDLDVDGFIFLGTPTQKTESLLRDQYT